MTIGQIEKNASYLYCCRENFRTGIRLADGNRKNKEGYQKLVQIAKLYIDHNELDRFAGYLMEGHYYVQLWTAHLIVEYGQPDSILKQRCLDEITKYAHHSPDRAVSAQEQAWLEAYGRTNTTVPAENRSDT
ncbi:MAG TPA: hypothetical protein VHK69_22105 [Chitinophagaceae bacterium]|jgi:hypothetical protein|nr:hypothetical protein [Chitinophagaceae bacterium]